MGIEWTARMVGVEEEAGESGKCMPGELLAVLGELSAAATRRVALALRLLLALLLAEFGSFTVEEDG